MSVARISELLQRRPPPGRFREQLFWLVDLIYACKSSSDEGVRRQATLVEQALGALGDYLETGNTEALQRATSQVEKFALLVRRATTQEGR